MRRNLLIWGAVLWLVLGGIWLVTDRGAADPARTDWLGIAVATLALLLAYELSNTAIRWFRQRRGRGADDA